MRGRKLLEGEDGSRTEGSGRGARDVIARPGVLQDAHEVPALISFPIPSSFRILNRLEDSGSRVEVVGEGTYGSLSMSCFPFVSTVSNPLRLPPGVNIPGSRC